MQFLSTPKLLKTYKPASTVGLSLILLGAGGCSWLSDFEIGGNLGSGGFTQGLYGGASVVQSTLEPDTSQSDVFTVDESSGSGFSLTLGKEFSSRLSGELRYGNLGTATLTPAADVEYAFLGASGLYYPFSNEGLSPFLRGGVNMMRHDATIALEAEDNFQVVAGLGLDYMFGEKLGLRAEYNYHDTDAQAAHIGLVYRFGERDDGFSSTQTPASRAPVSRQPSLTAPVPQPQPQTQQRQPQPQPQRRSSGPLLATGVVDGIQFARASAALNAQSRSVLDQLANEIRFDRGVKVELQAHTDAARGADFALQLARARVAQVGRYLISRGVPAGQLGARAFGASRPLYRDPMSPRNNRIELVIVPQ